LLVRAGLGKRHAAFAAAGYRGLAALQALAALPSHEATIALLVRVKLTNAEAKAFRAALARIDTRANAAAPVQPSRNQLLGNHPLGTSL
jgi:hypothetical protein